MWNSWEKIKSPIPCEQNYVALQDKNNKTVFSKLTQNIYSSISGEQASRQANIMYFLFWANVSWILNK